MNLIFDAANIFANSTAAGPVKVELGGGEPFFVGCALLGTEAHEIHRIRRMTFLSRTTASVALAVPLSLATMIVGINNSYCSAANISFETRQITIRPRFAFCLYSENTIHPARTHGKTSPKSRQ